MGLENKAKKHKGRQDKGSRVEFLCFSDVAGFFLVIKPSNLSPLIFLYAPCIISVAISCKR